MRHAIYVAYKTINMSDCEVAIKSYSHIRGPGCRGRIKSDKIGLRRALISNRRYEKLDGLIVIYNIRRPILLDGRLADITIGEGTNNEYWWKRYNSCLLRAKSTAGKPNTYCGKPTQLKVPVLCLHKSCSCYTNIHSIIAYAKY
jgi:hypothetical protein